MICVTTAIYSGENGLCIHWIRYWIDLSTSLGAMEMRKMLTPFRIEQRLSVVQSAAQFFYRLRCEACILGLEQYKTEF